MTADISIASAISSLGYASGNLSWSLVDKGQHRVTQLSDARKWLNMALSEIGKAEAEAAKHMPHHRE